MWISLRVVYRLLFDRLLQDPCRHGDIPCLLGMINLLVSALHRSTAFRIERRQDGHKLVVSRLQQLRREGPMSSVWQDQTL